RGAGEEGCERLAGQSFGARRNPAREASHWGRQRSAGRSSKRRPCACRARIAGAPTCTGAHIRFERGRIGLVRAKGGRLVRHDTYQDRRVVEATLTPEPVLVGFDHVAIDRRPEARGSLGTLRSLRETVPWPAASPPACMLTSTTP